MFLQIDHVAFAVSDCQKNFLNFQKIGYQLNFFEKNLNNLSIKKSFLHNYQLKHDLMLLKKPGSFSIELLDHGNLYEETFLYHSNFLEPFNHIQITVNSMSASLKFWQTLGFQRQSDQSLLFFSFLDRTNYKISLVENSQVQELYLDNKGLNCIAFISNNIKDDWNLLKPVSKNITKVENLIVNDKNLEIFFCQGPSNELVEIIGISK
jgi:hypothetical protein